VTVVNKTFWWAFRLPVLAAMLVTLALVSQPPARLDNWTASGASLLLAGIFALIYTWLYRDAPPFAHQRLWLLLGMVAVVAITLLRINGLSVYPEINLTDEPWDLGWIVNFIRNGQPQDATLFLNGQDVPYFYAPMALWGRLVGVGLWEMRLYTFLLTFVLIAFTMLAARNLYGNSVAVMAGIFLFCSANLMIAARIRHDIGLGIVLAASLWLHTEALKRNRHYLHFLAGVVMGSGLFVHYHSTLFGVVMAAVLYLPLLKQRQWRPALLYMLGGLLAALIVFLVQIWPQWSAFVATRSPRNPENPFMFFYTFLWHGSNLPRHSQIDFFLVIAGLIAAFFRRTKTDLQIAWLVVLLHLALTLMASLALDYYLVPMTPFYALLVATLFAAGFRQSPHTRYKLTSAGAARFVLFSATALFLTLQLPVRHWLDGGSLRPPPPQAAAWIQANIPKDETVVAEFSYYFWLTDYRFYVPFSVDYAEKYGYNDADAVWDAMDVDVFVFDPNLSTYQLQEPMRNLKASGYLRSRGYERVAVFSDQLYPVEVYRRDSANPIDTFG
jgi:MFS family permease